MILTSKTKLAAGHKGWAPLSSVGPIDGQIAGIRVTTPVASSTAQLVLNDRTVGSFQLDKVKAVTFPKPLLVVPKDSVGLRLFVPPSAPLAADTELVVEIETKDV